MSPVTTQNVNPASLQQTSTGAINMLANNAPASLTSMLMPLYQQLFGSQTGALGQTTALQGQQGMAQAQSNSQQRGLTGSSIEAGAMQGALSSSQRDYTQGYASLLGNYVNSYANAAGSDISNKNTYYTNLAQALGQASASNIQQEQFQQQLQAGLSVASENADAQKTAGLYSGIGSAVGGIAGGIGAAGGFSAMFSDIRLKKNVRLIGKKYGFNVYTYEYDREECPELKDRLPVGTFVGFMAHHVAQKYPEAVRVMKGYLMLDYNKLAEVALA
jgi:hypothetical protein